MGCRGVHFSLDEQQVSALRGTSEDHRVEYVQEEIEDVAAALNGVTRDVLRRGYDRIDPAAYQGEIGEEDFEYTWSWLRGLTDFYGRAAAEGRSVIFHGGPVVDPSSRRLRSGGHAIPSGLRCFGPGPGAARRGERLRDPPAAGVGLDNRDVSMSLGSVGGATSGAARDGARGSSVEEPSDLARPPADQKGLGGQPSGFQSTGLA
jgi:hypothetical protein